MTKVRLSNKKIPIVQGRYKGIDRDRRVCHLCPSPNLGDEFHYIFECPSFSKDRSKYLKPYYRIRPNTVKMEHLLTCNSTQHLKKLITFIRIIMVNFK